MRATEDTPQADAPLLDWARVGRRIGWSAAALGTLAVVAWLVVGLASGGPSLGELGGYLGLAAGGLFVAEVVVVGGAAVRALLRAGERGERLAQRDVGLLPPQVTRWMGRRR